MLRTTEIRRHGFETGVTTPKTTTQCSNPIKRWAPVANGGACGATRLMIEKPFVGQVVQLNDFGKRHIGGLSTEEMIKQARRMVITDVHDIDMEHLSLWEIEVDQPEINVFMLDNKCIDPYTPTLHAD